MAPTTLAVTCCSDDTIPKAECSEAFFDCQSRWKLSKDNGTSRLNRVKNGACDKQCRDNRDMANSIFRAAQSEEAQGRCSITSSRLTKVRMPAWTLKANGGPLGSQAESRYPLHARRGDGIPRSHPEKSDSNQSPCARLHRYSLQFVTRELAVCNSLAAPHVRRPSLSYASLRV